MKLLIVFVSLFIFSLCGRLHTIFNPDHFQESFLTENPCELPCLYDLELGMSFETMMANLESYFLPEHIQARDNNVMVCLTTPQDSCQGTIMIDLIEETNTVHEILVVFSPESTSCDLIYYQLQSPSSFYVIEESTNFGEITSYVMFYDSSGVEIVLVPSTENPHHSWVESLWIHNPLNYAERRTAFVQENQPSPQDFDVTEFCQENHE